MEKFRMVRKDFLINRAYQRMKNEAAFGHEECGKSGKLGARFASFFMAAQAAASCLRQQTLH